MGLYSKATVMNNYIFHIFIDSFMNVDQILFDHHVGNSKLLTSQTVQFSVREKKIHRKKHREKETKQKVVNGRNLDFDINDNEMIVIATSQHAARVSLENTTYFTDNLTLLPRTMNIELTTRWNVLKRQAKDWFTTWLTFFCFLCLPHRKMMKCFRLQIHSK